MLCRTCQTGKISHATGEPGCAGFTRFAAVQYFPDSYESDIAASKYKVTQNKNYFNKIILTETR